MNGFELIPSADRVITSLRALGYDLPQAIADIVDNSIAANATQIDIHVELESESPSIMIADNGYGMSDGRLREALRYGSSRNYEKDDLGKFGLGLKTASLSQCQVLTVASRARGGKAISAYMWDLAHIAKTNRWEILKLHNGALRQSLLTHLRGSSGTVVQWERLDQVGGYDRLSGAVAKKRLLQLCREIETHIGMIYHRFMTGLNGRRKLKIRLNGVELRPWDPFCASERKTRRLKPRTVTFRLGDKNYPIVLEPVILPAQSEFSTLEAFREAGGPLGWNLQQGLYFYRGGRMIQSGGWSRLRAPDEHTKLARVAIHFPPELDDAFRINVAKMKVQVPLAFRDQIENDISNLALRARERYSRKLLLAPSDSDSSTKKRRSGRKSSEPRTKKQTSDLTIYQFADLVLAAARGKEKKTVRKVLLRLI